MRKEILNRPDVGSIKIFDTFKNESGRKDVILIKQNNQKKIVRIGEARPDYFFSDGYQGEYLVIPKIYEINKQEIVYEIEEYLEGPTLWKKLGRSNSFFLPEDLWDLLFSAFWEFQSVAKELPFEQKMTIEKVIKHFDKAKELIPDQKETLSLIKKLESKWNSSYPSKWKFALDNLIYIKDKKIGFIDNDNVGSRFLGYDLGWVIWPGWVHMRTKDYRNRFDQYIKYLKSIEKRFARSCPSNLDLDEKLSDAFWLAIFERIIGALYDVVNQTKHLAPARIIKNSVKEKEHTNFLVRLLKVVSDRLE